MQSPRFDNPKLQREIDAEEGALLETALEEAHDLLGRQLDLITDLRTNLLTTLDGRSREISQVREFAREALKNAEG